MRDYGWLKAAGGANAAIEMGSLPKLMRGTLECLSRNRTHSSSPTRWKMCCWAGFLASVGNGPFIGLCWSSGKTGGHRAVQYAPLEAWAEFIAKLPGTLLSVQYDAPDAEIAALERMSGRTIFVPPGLDQKNELDRTAAMLSALDAVVSAPTAVSWLAAGAGVDLQDPVRHIAGRVSDRATNRSGRPAVHDAADARRLGGRVRQARCADYSAALTPAPPRAQHARQIGRDARGPSPSTVIKPGRAHFAAARRIVHQSRTHAIGDFSIRSRLARRRAKRPCPPARMRTPKAA